MAALMVPVEIVTKLFVAVKWVTINVVFPITKIMFFFMAFVLMVTFIANIAGILGFFIFILMFYYYVKGIIMIEPS